MNKKRLAALGLSALIVVWAIHYTTNHFPGSIKGHTVPAPQGPSALVRSLRPIYPYSVIAGGVYSPGELTFAHGKDAVVRAHYADFDVKHAKLVSLTDDRFQYVSYRLHDQVFWTKKRLRIPKGELLLTDGENYARARCGNRLSDHPHMDATNAHEPDKALLSLPPADRQTLPKMALANAPSLGDVAVNSVPVLPAQTGAVLPSEAENLTPAAKAIVPEEPVWGGQPIVGGSFVAGSPLLPVSGSSIGSSSPSIPSKTSSPPTPTNPVTPPVGAPPPVTPVPEPDSIYLFLIGLGVSTWALLRMTPKDNRGRSM